MMVGLGMVGALAGSGCGGSHEPVIEPTPNVASYCPFKDRAAIEVRALVGMSEAAATRRAAAHGCEVAVIERDGEEFAVPDNLRWDRVSVVVNDGVVTGLRGVG